SFFALFMMYVVTVHKRNQSLTPVEVSFWYSIWVAFIILALFPNLLLGITHVLNFGRVFDLLVVMAMMVLSVTVILSYFKQKELTKKLEDFVRRESLRK